MSGDEKIKLLRQFAPTLHFDALELWRPDRVDEYLAHSAIVDDGGKALERTPPAEPAMREHGEDRRARLSPLRDAPGLDTRRRSNEMLDAYGRERDLNGAGTAYGRVLSAADGHFLQYWLFYVDNPCVLPPGRHDGDWELVQVRVERIDDEDLRAIRVTLAGHGKPETRSVEAGDDRAGPDVFVAVDSHACYFLEGAHPMIPLSDVCTPAGAPGTKPTVELLPIAPDKRDWAHWSGRWGMDRGPGTRLALRLRLERTPWPLTRLNKVGAGESPPSPGHQGKSWRFPKAFALDGTRRKASVKLVQRLAHFIGRATWPREQPRVEVVPVPTAAGTAPAGYEIVTESAGRFLRRVTRVSVAFQEERPDGSRHALATHAVRAGRTAGPLAIAHEGSLRWRAAGYNRLRQRGEPI